MREVFADTNYWIALISPKDQWRQRAVEVSRTLGPVHLVTTDEVLIEVLNFFADLGSGARWTAVINVQTILGNQSVEVLPSSHEVFIAGLMLY